MPIGLLEPDLALTAPSMATSACRRKLPSDDHSTHSLSAKPYPPVNGTTRRASPLTTPPHDPVTSCRRETARTRPFSPHRFQPPTSVRPQTCCSCDIRGRGIRSCRQCARDPTEHRAGSSRRTKRRARSPPQLSVPTSSAGGDAQPHSPGPLTSRAEPRTRGRASGSVRYCRAAGSADSRTHTGRPRQQTPPEGCEALSEALTARTPPSRARACARARVRGTFQGSGQRTCSQRVPGLQQDQGALPTLCSHVVTCPRSAWSSGGRSSGER